MACHPWPSQPYELAPADYEQDLTENTAKAASLFGIYASSGIVARRSQSHHADIGAEFPIEKTRPLLASFPKHKGTNCKRTA